MEFKLETMSCGHCVSTVIATVKALDPQAVVAVDLAAKRVSVQSDKDPAAVADALAEAGYPPSR